MTELTVALIDSWVAGWCASRSVTHERAGRSWMLEVGDAKRLREYVGWSSAVEDIHHIAGRIASDPDQRLTIVGSRPDGVRDAVSGLDVVTEDEAMMTTTLAPTALPERITLEEVGQAAFATVTLDDMVAAHGQAAIVGEDVIFDRIRTDSQHQRRGLGRRVMNALASWGAGRGGTRGVLVASEEGRLFYPTLGWREVAPVATYRGRS